MALIRTNASSIKSVEILSSSKESGAGTSTVSNNDGNYIVLSPDERVTSVTGLTKLANSSNEIGIYTINSNAASFVRNDTVNELIFTLS